ncbi:hypothetical protein [uncultured Mediterranean phage uvMED]|nr:hypothetical protein [uncultured Mediterranean phage uvMED]
MINKYLNKIFEPGEFVAVGYHEKETKIRVIESVKDDDYQFFSINPFKEGTQRKDKNVSSFRNILIEMDEVKPKKQALIYKNLKIKPTLMTFSGGKSIHAIFSLKTPLENKEEFKGYAKALAYHIKLRFGAVVDSRCLHPSRFSRFPGGRRYDGNFQEVLYEGNKIDTTHFKSWLASPYNHMKEKQKIWDYQKQNRDLIDISGKKVPADALKFVRSSWDDNKDNNWMIYTTRCFKNAGFSLGDFLQLVEEQKGEEVEENAVKQITAVYESNEY